MLLIFNKDEKNATRINEVILAQNKKLAEETDGYSIFRESLGADYFYGEPNYTQNNIAINTAYYGSGTQIIHFRKSSSGEKGINGLHLHPINTHYLTAHNGKVSDFEKVTVRNDSHFFFKHLINNKKKKHPFDTDLINEYIKEYKFHGKGVLYNMKTKECMFFCNQAGYLNIFDGFIIFSTYDLETDKYTSHTQLNMIWYEKEGEIEKALHTERIDNKSFYFKDNLCVSSGYITNPYTGNFK